jgi:hypothetical protein
MRKYFSGIFTAFLLMAWQHSATAQQYFRSVPAGWTDQKAEDHWRIEKNVSDTDWVTMLVPPVIRGGGAFAAWFNGEATRFTDSVFGPAISRSSATRLNWRPTAKATMTVLSIHERDGQLLSVNVIGYATEYGNQLFFTVFPASTDAADGKVLEAIGFIQQMRDEGFALTLDMLRWEQQQAAQPQQPSSPASGSTQTSATRGCRNYQTGSYNKTDTRCTNYGCTTTTTPVPLYSMVCN